ncbi:MAG: outer membrane protein assembly factor BamA [Alphaproteobacteria bacterium]|nr:outer membrane protein assembly factor BamA [Alphaproteobacteria bacterium]
MILLRLILLLLVCTVYGKIRIKGNVRISKDAILNKLPPYNDEFLDKMALDAYVKSLYETNLFAQVNASYDAEGLVISVCELPSVNSVTFEGNSAVDGAVLEKDLGIKERQILSKDQLRKSLLRVSMIYRQMGFFKARILLEVVYQDQNRVDIIFKIEEGPAAKITDVLFLGNQDFSSFDLRGVVSCKAFYWWRLLKNDSLYNPENAHNDAEILKNHYQNHGYLDFELSSMSAQLSLLTEAFTLLYNIKEGRPYRVKSITLENTLSGIPSPKKTKYVLRKGRTYRRGQALEDVDRLESWFAKHGYPYVHIKTMHHRLPKSLEVNVIYRAYVGHRITVRRVSIEGNKRTYNRVLYPLLSVWEGDLLDSRQITISTQALEHTGFFESVTCEKDPVPGEPDAVDVRFIVKERSTGALGLRMTYSGSTGTRAEAYFDEPNFLGKGYLLRTQAAMGSYIWDTSVTFSDPAFLNRNLLFGATVHLSGKTARDVSKVQTRDAYTVYTRGLRLFMGIPLRRHWTLRPTYAISSESFETKYSRVYSIKKGQFSKEKLLTQSLQETFGRHGWPKSSIFISKVGLGIACDKRDRRFDVTKGLFALLNVEVAGIGGHVKTWEISFDCDYHHKISDILTLRARGSASMLRPWSDRYGLRVCDRYRLGGPYSLRGFREWGVGPKMKAFDEPVGGDTTIHGTLELLFPIGLPKEARFRGFIFLDCGTTWDRYANLPSNAFDNASLLRVSVGLGLRWASPMGVLSVSYGIPLQKHKNDDEERVNLGMRSMSAARDDFL